MATKTSDYRISSETFTIDGTLIDAKKKTAIRIDGITKSDVSSLTMKIEDGNLVITNSDGESIKVKNYSSIKYIKTDYVKKGKKEYYNLTNIIDSNLVDNTTNPITKIVTNFKKKTATLNGTVYNDEISASAYDGSYKLYINANSGNDNIVGSNKKDIINAGNGNDTIEGSKSNDTITGGKGSNIVHYADSEFDTDTINLTKGETLNLNFDDTENEFYQVKKDIAISNGDNGTVILKNYATKNTGAKVLVNGHDLVTENLLETIDTTNYFSKSRTKYTGTMLADSIDASELDGLTKTVKQGKKKVAVAKEITDRGVEINSGNGNDIVTGSKYSDIIKGGNGNDTITGGTGNDKLYGGSGTNTFVFEGDFGKDTIYDENVSAKNTLIFDNLDDCSIKKSGNNLIIYKDSENYVTLSNYYSTKLKHKATYTITVDGEDEVSLGEFLTDKVATVSGTGSISGTANDDIITVANKKNATISTGKGDDLITYSKGGKTMYFYQGDGNDSIASGGGTDVLKFQKNTTVTAELVYNADATANLIIHYGNNGDTVTLLNYKSNDNRKYYYIGNKKYSISSLAHKGTNINIKEFSTHYDGTVYNDTITDSLEHYTVMTINAGDGDDYIDANHDTVYGGAGNDYICGVNSNAFGGDDNDVIINYASGTSTTSTYEIYGNSGDDTLVNNEGAYIKNMYGDDSIGTGNDSITNYGTVVNNIYTGDGNNTVENNGIINESIIGGAGDDTITISGAVKKSVETADGNDVIVISGSVRSSIITASGDDTITITTSGAVGSAIYGGDGNDSIVIQNGASTKYIYSDNDTISSTKDGNDSVTVSGIISNNLYTTGGNDTITITNTGSVGGNIYGGDGDDSIILENKATVTTIYADGPSNASSTSSRDGNDTIFISGAVKNNIYSSGGKDTITISSTGSIGGTIYAGDGSDNIVIQKGASAKNIYSDDSTGSNGGGDDSVTVSGIITNDLYTTRGKDTITITETGSVHGTIDAGDGDDSVTISGTVAALYTGTGSDLITLTGLGKVDGIISGGTGNDTIIGGIGNDSIDGGAGSDEIHPGSGTNTITITLDSGNDIYYYENGTDTIEFNSSSYLLSTIKFYKENNDLKMTYGEDNSQSLTIKNYFNLDNPDISVYGYTTTSDLSKKSIKTLVNENNVIIIGSDESDTIFGTSHNDSITALSGDDKITDTVGSNYLSGGAGNDTITSGTGNDTIDGDLDSDEIHPGEGTNTITLTLDSGDDIYYYENGTDTIEFKSTTYLLSTIKFYEENNDLKMTYGENNSQSLTIKNYFNLDNPDINVYGYITTSDLAKKSIKTLVNENNVIIIGSDESDTIFGTSHNDSITALGGDDDIIVSAGNDIINPGTGNNTIILTSTSGNGAYTYQNGNDTLSFIGDFCSLDSIQFCKMNSNLVIRYGENNLQAITINDYFNLESPSISISGYDSTNVLQTDTIVNFINKNNLIIQGTTGNDSIVSNQYNNVTIYGYEGSDTIYGGDGDDFIDAGNGYNRLDGGSGNDTIRAGEGNDTIYGRDGNDSIYSGSGSNQLYGGSGDDTIISEGSDTIYGGDGDDSINARNGNYLYGGSGDDTIICCGTGYYHYIEGGKGNDSIICGDDAITSSTGDYHLVGGEGNDTYNIIMNQNYNIFIDDMDGTVSGGDYDILNINANINNISLMFDVYKDDDGTWTSYIDKNSVIYSDTTRNDSLLIFNKDFLTLENLSNYMNGSGSGVLEIHTYFYSTDGTIETINAKNDSGEYSTIQMDSWIGRITSQVATWMDAHTDYDSSMAVFNGESETDKTSLLAIYQNSTYNQ